MEKPDNELKTVAVATLGCKVNQCESASFQAGFAERGFSLVSPDLPADIYVINTCAVTAKAAAQSRQLIRRVQRTNPGAKVVVTGCYAQTAPVKIKQIAAAPLTIVGNANKHQIFEAAAVAPDTAAALPQTPDSRFFDNITLQKEIRPLPVKRFSGRTRAFLKVQDGCNCFCSYCIVPYARGRSRSISPDRVLQQARIYAGAGHREIVLTGIHVGHFGLDLEPKCSLLDLLQELCTAFPEIRFRLSSLEPTEISHELLIFMRDTDNFMPHLHIPLQSGSNRILKNMQRRYASEQFTDIVEQTKNMIPAAAIGVDVLAGFPGETEDDFQQTYELIKRLPITYLHVFPYSRRPGTPAAKMKFQVASKTKQERVADLRRLDHKKRTAFYGTGIGKVRPVLVETEKSADGLAKGFTDNYIPVRFNAEPEDVSRVVQVRLLKIQDRFVTGTLL